MTDVKTESLRLKDLNIRHDTIKFLEENISKTFSDINCANVFLGQSPKAIEIKTTTNKWDLIKLICFCTAKKTINKTKRQPTDWEKTSVNVVTNQGLISKIYKQLTQFNNKNNNKNFQNMSRRSRHF